MNGIVTIPGVLDPDTCARLIAHAERRGFEPAPINGLGGVERVPEVRNNGRVMEDDPRFAAALWPKVSAHLPAEIGELRAIGLNERFRFYRYAPGEYFRFHGDGAFARGRHERSFFTVMVYLNEGFEGGETEFADGTRVVPRTGLALLFHHPLLHQGAPVVRGTKYVVRTDAMYRLEAVHGLHPERYR